MSNVRIMGTSAFDDSTDLAVSQLDQAEAMEVATFNLNTSTGTQDITLSSNVGKGRTPIAAMFGIGNITGTDTLTDSLGGIGIGFFDGENNLCRVAVDKDSANPSDGYRRSAQDGCLMMLGGAGALLAKAEGDSFIENGVRINVTTAGSAYRCWVALFFDDDDNASAKAKLITHPTTSTETTFNADVPITCMFVLPTEDAWDDSTQDGANISMGFWSPGKGQAGMYWQSADNVSTTAVTAEIRDSYAGVVNTSSRILMSDKDETKFNMTVNGTALTGGQTAILALNLPNAAALVGVLDTETSLPSTATYGASQPDSGSAVFITSSLESVNTSIGTGHAENFGVGVASNDDMYMLQTASEDALDTTTVGTDTETRYADGQVFSQQADTTDAVKTQGFSESSSGFSLTYNTVHGTAKKWPFMALTATQDPSPIQRPDVRDVYRGHDNNQVTFQGSFSARTINMVHLENVNDVDGNMTFIVQLSDDGFATTKYDTGAQSMWDKKLTYYAGTWYFADQFNITDAKVVLADTGNSDGYIEVGRIKLGQYFDAPNSKNVSVGPKFSYQEIGQLTQTRGGGFVAESRNPARRLRLVWDFAKEDDLWDIDANSFAEILEHIGHRDDIFISVYPNEVNDKERRFTILGRIIENSGLDHHFNTIENGALKAYARLLLTIQESL